MVTTTHLINNKKILMCFHFRNVTFFHQLESRPKEYFFSKRTKCCFVKVLYVFLNNIYNTCSILCFYKLFIFHCHGFSKTKSKQFINNSSI